MTWIRAHAKALVPALATLLSVGTLAAITGEINQEELYAAVVGLLVAAGVYRIPNARDETGHSLIELLVALILLLLLIWLVVALVGPDANAATFAARYWGC